MFSYLIKGKDGQLGITGEGSLIENAKGIYFYTLYIKKELTLF